jgi:hypothetical protein
MTENNETLKKLTVQMTSKEYACLKQKAYGNLRNISQFIRESLCK